MSGATGRTRERNNNWRGGRHIGSNGYFKRLAPEHPSADSKGYVYEHRLVAEDLLGRRLQSGEIVHHKNGIKTDNRPENVEVLPSFAHHRVRHRRRDGRRLPGEDNPIVQCFCRCGMTFMKFDSSGRPRRFVSGHNALEGRHVGA